MAHRYMRDNGNGLTIHVNFMIKCVCYMGLGSNGSDQTSVALMGSHYKTYIISSVGHPRSNSVVPLVLCMVAYNIRGTAVVLQVSQDRTNFAENG
jgi:hypothetical protein